MRQIQNVLIVDDEQANIAQVAELFKQQGFNVATASDGFKALAACKVRVPDIILLDVHMPLMSGLEVFNKLRSEEKTKFIPVVFIKSKTEPPPPLEKELLDEVPILSKPLDGNDSVVLVKTILREKILREEIRKKEGQIKELALSDPLTSCRNTRFLMEFLKTELAQSQRYDTALTLLMIEPDQFKDIQKQFGVKGADSLILQLAVVLSRHNRRSDVLARLLPSEFAMVLTQTSKTGAIEVAERIRLVIQQSSFTVGETTVPITVSIGISQFSKEMDIEGATLLSHSRAALAQGRASGGNVTLIAQ